MSLTKKIATVAKECVACGCCIKDCPMKAITVHKGLRATVDGKTCIGCGKCAKICPAGVIDVREVEAYEKTVV